MNEHLARRANAEDGCTGRFWEGRFKSQALLDEAGLLTAMAYVDLNPVRAGIAQSPEESPFTSIYARIAQLRSASGPPSADAVEQSAPPLLSFASEDGSKKSIPFSLRDYLQLVDWTGRQRRADKRGAIAAMRPPILQRLSIDQDAWCSAMRSRNNLFGRALGRVNHLELHAKTLGQSWVRGLRAAERAYG